MKTTHLLFICLIFAGCSNDPLVGLWQKTGVEIDGKMEWEWRPGIICFAENGTYQAGNRKNNLIHPGVWTFDSEKNILSLQDIDGPEVEYDVCSANDSTMTLTFKTNTYTVYMKKLKSTCAQ